MQKIKLPAWYPELEKVSRFVLGNMQFNVLLSTIAAVNEMRNAVAIIRDRRDIYRQRVKQSVNVAIRTADTLKHTYMLFTNFPNELDEFSDHIIDMTESDVTKLRLLVLADLRKKGSDDKELGAWLEYAASENGKNNAEVIAWVSTALLLLHLANEHYRVVIQQGNTQFRSAVKRLALEQKALAGLMEHDYSHDFSGHSPAALLSAWKQVEKQIDPTPDVLIGERILTQLRLISKNYGNGTYLRQCLDEMKDNEHFSSIVVGEAAKE